MTLAALISAGAPADYITSNLEKLRIPFELKVTDVEISATRALQVEVVASEEHVHRTFRDIREILEGAGLPDRAASRALEAFRLLAVAEGAVHGRDPEEVTFHEVGAADSIVDLAGSCLALEALSVDSVSCGPLPMGSGAVHSAHGPLPVPGPAVLEILKGSRVRWAEEAREMTTPTGAALMSSLTGGNFTEAAPPMTPGAIGYGAGKARFESVPNLLRAVAGEVEGAVGDVELLEANVDDAPGEFLGAAAEKLLEAGALDAWLEPIFMKRGRGAYKVCALANGPDRERLARLLMRDTGALGVRHRGVGRTVAGRRRVEVELPYGTCLVKVGSIDGEDFVVAPEYKDASRLSGESGFPLPKVYADARDAFYSGKSEPSRASQSL